MSWNQETLKQEINENLKLIDSVAKENPSMTPSAVNLAQSQYLGRILYQHSIKNLGGF